MSVLAVVRSKKEAGALIRWGAIFALALELAD